MQIVYRFTNNFIEKRLVQKTQPKLLETLEPVTTDTFGVGGNKLPVLGTIKNYRFIHNNRECHTDALVVDVDLGSCSLILGMKVGSKYLYYVPSQSIP